MRNGYNAYATYQGIANKAHQIYLETKAPVWADITWAAVQLSLTERRDYPEGN